jgi:hypothetical protein
MQRDWRIIKILNNSAIHCRNKLNQDFGQKEEHQRS